MELIGFGFAEVSDLEEPCDFKWSESVRDDNFWSKHEEELEFM